MLNVEQRSLVERARRLLNGVLAANQAGNDTYEYAEQIELAGHYLTDTHLDGGEPAPVLRVERRAVARDVRHNVWDRPREETG